MGAVIDVGLDESSLLFWSGVTLGIQRIRSPRIMVVVAPFRLAEAAVSSDSCIRSVLVLTNWLANSKPGMFAEAYSKSITTSCLCSLAGRRRGDSPLGLSRSRLPYCVCQGQLR